jgi:hypothetical protein
MYEQPYREASQSSYGKERGVNEEYLVIGLKGPGMYEVVRGRILCTAIWGSPEASWNTGTRVRYPRMREDESDVRLRDRRRAQQTTM